MAMRFQSMQFNPRAGSRCKTPGLIATRKLARGLFLAPAVVKGAVSPAVKAVRVQSWLLYSFDGVHRWIGDGNAPTIFLQECEALAIVDCRPSPGMLSTCEFYRALAPAMPIHDTVSVADVDSSGRTKNGWKRQTVSSKEEPCFTRVSCHQKREELFGSHELQDRVSSGNGYRGDRRVSNSYRQTRPNRSGS